MSLLEALYIILQNFSLFEFVSLLCILFGVLYYLIYLNVYESCLNHYFWLNRIHIKRIDIMIYVTAIFIIVHYNQLRNIWN